MMKNYLLALIITYFATISVHGQSVLVNTSRGQVIGYHFDQGSNLSALFYGQADVFEGIPYALPPQRYAKPQRLDKFPQDPYNATYYRGYCPNGGVDGLTSEDCLNLNIYSPNASATTKLPVMIYIHGGGFFSGTSLWSPLQGVVRNIVARGVVFGTINYRLGFLGFFTTHTDDFPSNLGLLDQVEALKFIQEEISNFGGDPTRVTIFGESAGAVSVSAHTYSPLSQDLFQQSIQESGTVLMGFEGALGKNHPSFRFAQAACNYTLPMWNSGNYSALKDCLMKIDVEAGLTIQNHVFGSQLIFSVGATVCWDMVQDNNFFPGVPRNIYKNRKEKPAIIGTCRDEYVLWENTAIYRNLTRSVAENILASKFTTFFGNHAQEALEIYEGVYLNPNTKDDDHGGWHDFIDHVGTSLLFTSFAAQDIEQHIWNNNPNVYVYEFTYPSTGYVSHTAEKGYLFMSGWKENTTSTIQIDIANFMGESWTNFAKYGKPSVNDTWKPTTSTDLTSMEYYEINNVTLNGMRVGYRTLDRITMNHVLPEFVGVFPPDSPDFNNGSYIGCPTNWTLSTVNNKRCYDIYSFPLTQEYGQATCVNHLGSLLSIDNSFENNAIIALIASAAPQCAKLYIGLIRNGTTWGWSNGDPSKYINWDVGNPSSDPNANCGVFNSVSGKWSNQACDSQQCFICSFDF